MTAEDALRAQPAVDSNYIWRKFHQLAEFETLSAQLPVCCYFTDVTYFKNTSVQNCKFRNLQTWAAPYQYYSVSMRGGPVNFWRIGINHFASDVLRAWRSLWKELTTLRAGEYGTAITSSSQIAIWRPKLQWGHFFIIAWHGRSCQKERRPTHIYTRRHTHTHTHSQ